MTENFIEPVTNNFSASALLCDRKICSTDVVWGKVSKRSTTTVDMLQNVDWLIRRPLFCPRKQENCDTAEKRHKSSTLAKVLVKAAACLKATCPKVWNQTVKGCPELYEMVWRCSSELMGWSGNGVSWFVLVNKHGGIRQDPQRRRDKGWVPAQSAFSELLLDPTC